MKGTEWRGRNGGDGMEWTEWRGRAHDSLEGLDLGKHLVERGGEARPLSLDARLVLNEETPLPVAARLGV